MKRGEHSQNQSHEVGAGRSSTGGTELIESRFSVILLAPLAGVDRASADGETQMSKSLRVLIACAVLAELAACAAPPPAPVITAPPPKPLDAKTQLENHS